MRIRVEGLLGSFSHDARDAADLMAFKRGNAMRWTADAASARKSMGSLAAATKQRRAAAEMKSQPLFADAGQDEADYRDDGSTDAADGTSPITRRNIRDMFGPNGGQGRMYHIAITEAAREPRPHGRDGDQGAGDPRGRGRDERPQATDFLTKAEFVETTLDEHLQRVCHSCRTRVAADGREVVQVPHAACPVCRGNGRAVREMVEACQRSNVEPSILPRDMAGRDTWRESEELGITNMCSIQARRLGCQRRSAYGA